MLNRLNKISTLPYLQCLIYKQHFILGSKLNAKKMFTWPPSCYFSFYKRISLTKATSQTCSTTCTKATTFKKIGNRWTAKYCNCAGI